MNTQTGCYVGCMTNDYELLSTRDIDNLAHVAASGNSQAMVANRLSWYFGLRGPSLTLDTACSASLYALHLACQSLRLGETSLVSKVFTVPLATSSRRLTS
jgi:acyl transferase domain-containing protein